MNNKVAKPIVILSVLAVSYLLTAVLAPLLIQQVPNANNYTLADPVHVEKDTVLDKFPVVFISQKDGNPVANVVYYSEREKFLQAHPDATNLIPVDDMSELNQQLAAQKTDLDGKPIYHAKVEIEENAPDHQDVKASLSWSNDITNIGWYESSDSGIKPLRRYIIDSGTMMTIVAPIWAACYAVITAVLGFAAFKFLQPSLAKASADPPA
jgi:hypothetical protein